MLDRGGCVRAEGLVVVHGLAVFETWEEWRSVRRMKEVCEGGKGGLNSYLSCAPRIQLGLRYDGIPFFLPRDVRLPGRVSGEEQGAFQASLGGSEHGKRTVKLDSERLGEVLCGARYLGVCAAAVVLEPFDKHLLDMSDLFRGV